MTRDAPIGKVIGYAGLIVPDRLLWMEFFLYEERLADARDVLDRARSALPPDASEIRHRTPHVDDADQGLVGPLCAGLTELACRGIPDAGLFALALHVLTKQRWFIVKAHHQPGGISTDIRFLPEVQIAMMQMMANEKDATKVVSDLIQKDDDVRSMKMRMDDALRRASPATIKKLDTFMRNNPMELRRNPMVMLKMLEDADPGISTNRKN